MDTELQKLVDRDAIRQCLERLARGEDRRNAALIRSCWWPDANYDYGVQSGSFEEYLAWVVPGADAIKNTQHVLGQSYIELTGEAARSETHVISYHRVDMGAGDQDTCIGGRYLDVMQKRGAEWRIASRVMLYDWFSDWGSAVNWSTGLMGMPLTAEHYSGRAQHDFSEQFFWRSPLTVRSLAGQVALVTGATRGVGKGTALALAREGAKVYVTGRTLTDGDHELPGSLASTVGDIVSSGGQAVGLPMDVLNDDDIASVFDAIARAEGRLDLLVNNAMAIPNSMTSRSGFWDKPLEDERLILDTGLRAVLSMCWHAARMMVPQGTGLIVSMSGYVGVTYTYDVAFGTAKAGIDRMMRDLGIELSGSGVSALSLWQGFTYTERAVENLKTVTGMSGQLSAAVGSTPEFPGRVIAAVAADAARARLNGGTFIAAELAEHYGVLDKGGASIPSLRNARGVPLWDPVG